MLERTASNLAAQLREFAVSVKHLDMPALAESLLDTAERLDDAAPMLAGVKSAGVRAVAFGEPAPQPRKMTSTDAVEELRRRGYPVVDEPERREAELRKVEGPADA